MTPTSRSPWRAGDLLSLAATVAIGGAALLVGWWGVSGEPRVTQQTPWLNVSIGGLVIAGVGNAVWLVTGRRAVGERRRRLLPDVADVLSSDTTDPLWTSADGVADKRTSPLVAIPGMTRYHLASCELVAGKQTRGLKQGRRPALAPCGVCRPDEIAA